MAYRFTDLVDIEAFRGMMKAFYAATGIPHGLIDSENNVLSGIGWQEACSDFHRANALTLARCRDSDQFVAAHPGGAPFVGYRCQNGLMDYAAPIVIDGRHLATIFFGQVLHEAPDLDFFRGQARACGFDETAYLAAIGKVPIVAKERAEAIMAFYAQLAQTLAASGRDRLRQRTEDALRDSEAHLQAILDSSPVGIGWSDIDGKVEYINNKFTELFGYRLGDIPTIDDWYRLAYPDKLFRREVVDRWARDVAAARVAGSEAPSLETPIVCKDGTVRHVIITVSWVGDHRLVNFSDITDRWSVEQREHARHSMLELIAKGASLAQTLDAIVRGVEAEDPSMLCAILLLDHDGKHLRAGAAPSLPDFFNRAFDGLAVGIGAGSCGAAALTRERVVAADIRSHPAWTNHKELATQAGLGSCWCEPVLAKGRLLGTFAIYHRQPRSPSENDLYLIGYAANLASIAIEHHQTQEELERQAHTDFLTELANRRYFLELAEAELARTLRYGKPFSLLMLDIDHFKAVNDSHGHKAGDMVLQELAGVMRKTLREVDVFGRLGGEEFAAILPETAGDKAREAAERLRLAVAAAVMALDDGTTLGITVSIGVTTLADKSNNIDLLLRQADAALYAAKHGGRNRVCMAG
ncbi:MAG: diguanylate cyclase [Rhodocyclaceae bacterium]|nr:diguanylate cyclase [Rhodocyclaceae bacterium]